VSAVAAPRRAGRREWVGLAVIALPCLLYAMDLTVLNLAVPHISADLQPSSTQLLWIVDIYGFLAAGSLVTMGTLGDRIGRRRLLLIGAAGFGAASVLAAFSTSPGMLIAARALLGVAGATLAPSTLSLIRNLFPDPASAPSPSASGSPASRPAPRSGRCWAACCWSRSGGARCSWSPCR
jgi:DHA2 family multidrug resistance protein-like MFS transporter